MFHLVVVAIGLLPFAAESGLELPSCSFAVSDAAQLTADCSARTLNTRVVGMKLRNFKGSTLVLDVSHDNLGIGMTMLAETISSLVNLTSLTLLARGNDINDKGARELGMTIGRLAQLKTLTLGLQYNGITAVGIGDLGAGLGRLSRTLVSLELRLRFNSIGSIGASALGAGLRRLTGLDSLDLDLFSTGIADAGAAALAGSIGELAHLTALKLDLQYNSLHAAGGRAVRAALAKSASLTSMQVEGIPPRDHISEIAAPEPPLLVAPGSLLAALVAGTAMPMSKPNDRPAEQPTVHPTAKPKLISMLRDNTTAPLVGKVVDPTTKGLNSTLAGEGPDVADAVRLVVFLFGVALAGVTAAFAWSRWGTSVREYSLNFLDGNLDVPMDSLVEAAESEHPGFAEINPRRSTSRSDSFEDLYTQSLAQLQVADRAE